MNINFYKWRPILAKITTLHEVNTYWDLNDLADANEALDLESDAEAFHLRNTNTGRKA